MKSPLLIFALKCSVILYFAACTGIGEYACSVSATPQITKGDWKIKLFTDAQNDQTNVFDGYTLTFEPTGKIIVAKNGEKVIGNWAEDDILKRITINLDTKDAALAKLNDYWQIARVTSGGLSFKKIETRSNDMLQIASLQ